MPSVFQLNPMVEGGRAEAASTDAESPPSSHSALKLDDLQPDVLHNIIYFLSDQDTASLCLTGRRLAANTLQACQHWAPKVESWLLADPTRAPLLHRLQQLDPLVLHRAEEQQEALSQSAQALTACSQEQQCQPAFNAATSGPTSDTSTLPLFSVVQSQNMQQTKSVVKAVTLDGAELQGSSGTEPKQPPLVNT